jgi:periplasmic glucans biosynthesis protein
MKIRSMVITLALVIFATGTLPAGGQQFNHGVVTELAERLARSPYEPQRLPADSPLRQLTYDQYRDIRFDSDQAIWGNEQVRFRVELLTAGFVFERPVNVSIVESGTVRNLQTTPEMFDTGPLVQHLANKPMALSGFRIRNRLNSPTVWDEFLVFQGATYFRAVSRGTLYGLSARGLAIRTAHPTGEEFPEFTHFWIERPSANAVGIVIHALMDSPSTTGAFRFSIIPGTETIMDVDLTLFPRVPLEYVGIAPLTSMFLFNNSDRTRIDDFRDAVHDSDGLQIVSAYGEQIWRSLANPTRLQVSSFTATAPRAFGLVQRARRLSDYNDFEAHYHQRPSAWIEPKGDWGPGAVKLVEIPTDSETNDNIVAFWQPEEVIPANKPWQKSYRLRWCAVPQAAPVVGKVISMRSGPSFDGKRRLFVIDFDKATPSPEKLRMEVTSSAGKLTHPVLQANPLTNGVRASFELDPENSSVAELLLRLTSGANPATETWLYRWTAN